MMLPSLTELELEQVMICLDARYPLKDKLAKIRPSYKEVDSIGEEETTAETIPAHENDALHVYKTVISYKLGLRSMAKINVWKKEGDLPWAFPPYDYAEDHVTIKETKEKINPKIRKASMLSEQINDLGEQSCNYSWRYYFRKPDAAARATRPRSGGAPMATRPSNSAATRLFRQGIHNATTSGELCSKSHQPPRCWGATTYLTGCRRRRGLRYARHGLPRTTHSGGVLRHVCALARSCHAH
jgi:hypothetical protein